MTEVSETAGKLAGSAAMMIIRKVAGSLLSTASSVVVVRCLAPGEFGRYAAGLAAFHLLLALTEFGFSEVLGRELGRGRADASSFGRLVLTVNLAWSALVALAGVVLAGFFAFGSTRGDTLLVLTPAIALAGLTAVRQFFYATHQVGRMATLDLTVSALTTAAVVALAVGGASAVVLAAALCAGSAVNGLGMLRLAWHWLAPRSGTATVPGVPRRQAVGVLARAAFPIGLASFLSTAYVLVDIVILSSVFPAEVIGQYASAVKVLSILTIFPGLVMSIVLPHLSADWGDPERLAMLSARVWHWFMSLVLPAVVIVAINAEPVMRLLFGDGYATAAPYLRILTLAGAISMLSQLLGVLVVAGGRAHWLVAQNFGALALNVGGNLAIAPVIGISAAAWLTVLTELVVCAGRWWVLRDRISVRPLLAVSARPALAVLIAAAAGLTVTGSTWVAIPLAGVVYLIALSALRGWPPEWIRLVKRGGGAA